MIPSTCITIIIIQNTRFMKKHCVGIYRIKKYYSYIKKIDSYYVNMLHINHHSHIPYDSEY